MPRTALATAAWTLALALACLAHAAEAVGIERLAPKDSWLVLGVDDVAAARERWNRTPVLKWWDSEPVQKLVKEELERSRKQAQERLRKLGVAEDAWSAPRSMGGAMYAARDEKLDSDQANFLLHGEWGEGADGVATVFEAVIAEYEKEKPGRVRQVEIRGRKALAIGVKPEEPKPEIGKDGRPRRPRPRRGGLFEEGGLFQQVATIWYVREGGHFLLGSQESDLAEALGVIEGQSRPCVQDDPDFRASLEQVGRGDGWAVLLTAPMQRVAGATGPQFAFLQPMLTALFGEVKAYGFSLVSDGPQSQFELVNGILVKGDRTGVLALPDPAVAAAAPPKFVPADSVGYGRMQVQFRDLMKLLETAISNMPEDTAAAFEPTLQQYGPDLRKAFDALGPELHVVSRSVQKADAGEREDQGVYALTCRDEQAVTGLMNLFLPEAGFKPRDFNGNTIFGSEDWGLSMGFGGGMFYLGADKMVEQCLRGGEGGLGDTPACKSALAAVGNDPVLGWGFTDLVAALEAQRKDLLASARRAEGRMIPKDQREIADRVGIDVPEGVVDDLKDIEPKSLGEGFGPMQWDMRTATGGLLTRLRLLRPVKAD